MQTHNCAKQIRSCLSLLAFLLLCLMTAPAMSAPALPSLKIGVTKMAPVIDGDFRDAAWDKASSCGNFHHYNGQTPATEETKVYVSYDDSNLYIFFLCFDKHIGELKKGESVFAGDVIEIFIDPGQTYNYTHIAVNASGKTYLAWQQGARRNDVRAAVKVMPDRWQAEIAIPWKDVGWPNSGTISNWGLNFCRTISRGKEYTCWSPTLVGFHNPSRFGLVTASMKVDAGDFYAAQQRREDTSSGILTVSTDRTFYGAEKELKANIRLRIDGSLADKKMILSITDSLGQGVAESSMAPVYLTSIKSVPIAGLLPGDYNLTVSLVGKNGVTGKGGAWFRKLPPMPRPANRVEIRDGITYLNDKPHLPIILYFGSAMWDKTKEMSVKDIDDAQAKGFNTLLTSWEFLKDDLVGEREKIWKPAGEGSASINRMKASALSLAEILDAAHRRNLQVIPYFGNMWRTEKLDDIERIKMGAVIIQKYRHHPAILCWHANDETDGWMELNRKVYRLYKELDPYRPVHLNLIQAVAANKDAADILSTDPYPIGKAPLIQVAAHGDTLRHVIGGNANQAAWLVLQMFGSPSEGWPRCPTPQEVKCMTFLALNHGSKGLAYFHYAPESVRRELGEKRLSDELWQSMARLNRETAAMAMPYLVGRDVDGIKSNAAELDVAARQYQGEIYIIACNTSEKKIDADISSSGVELPKTSEVLFEKRSVKTNGSVIKDQFAPYDVHIYKLTDKSKKSAAALEINVSSDLPLPLKNLAENGGFEEGMRRWSISGQAEKADEQGWKVELSREAHRGSSSLYVSSKRGSIWKTPGVWQEPNIFRVSPYSAGKSYIVSCWLKAGKDVGNDGGVYQGAGTSLSLYSSDWKSSVKAYARAGAAGDKWRRIISNPIKAEDWCKAAQMSVGLAYTDGESWIDDVCITEAFVNLTIAVKGSVKQVMLEDEKGNVLLDSNPLDGKDGEYKQHIRVPAQHTYTVTALDKNGGITRKVIVLDCE